MNLQQLEYFKQIAENKNFTTAANILSVTQPALSKAISNLEEELNVPLFHRNGRNIELTSYGGAFLKYAAEALLQIEKGIHEVKEIASQEQGIISIASTYCVGSYFMPYVIGGFLSEHPNSKFQFNHKSIPEIINDLKDHKITLGFYDSSDNIHLPLEIESLLINKEQYVLIVPKNHHLANKVSVSLNDIKEESFIAINEGNSPKMVSFSEFISNNTTIAHTANRMNMISGLIASGAGITIIPNTPLINTNTLSIIKIKEDIGYKTIYMCWLKDSFTPPNAKEFKDYIVSNSIIE